MDRHTGQSAWPLREGVYVKGSQSQQSQHNTQAAAASNARSTGYSSKERRGQQNPTIMQARDCAELLQLCSSMHLEKDDIVQIYVRITQVTKFARNEKTTVSQLLEILTRLTLERVKKMNMKDLKTIMSAFVACKIQVPGALAEGFVGQMMFAMDNFGNQNIADGLWACAKSGVHIPGSLVGQLEVCIRSSITQCTSKDFDSITISVGLHGESHHEPNWLLHSTSYQQHTMGVCHNGQGPC
jgi:hypothetical protein